MLWVFSTSLTVLTFTLMLTFSEVKSSQADVENEKIAFPKLQSKEFRKARAERTLPDPELGILRNKLKMRPEGSDEVHRGIKAKIEGFKGKQTFLAIARMSFPESSPSSPSESSPSPPSESSPSPPSESSPFSPSESSPFSGSSGFTETTTESMTGRDVVHRGIKAKIEGFKGKQTFLAIARMSFPETSSSSPSESSPSSPSESSPSSPSESSPFSGSSGFTETTTEPMTGRDLVHRGISSSSSPSESSPFSGSSGFTKTTTESITGPPASGSCNVLSGSVPNGCAENVYTVPSGFPGTGSGRGNPERGFYKHTESKTSNWVPVDAQQLQGFVAEGYTLIYRNIILDTFITSNISDAILQKIRNDFVTIRAASLKVILRFCYSIIQTVINDAAPLQLQKHIEQLAPIFQANADVIALMHGGFIGVWGEWYYTQNYGNEGVISAADYEKRRQVVFQLLDALPASRQIQLRLPIYKRTILGRTAAITAAEAHQGTKIARIAHHNDCFLASDLDWGTYTNKAEEYPYLQKETLYVSQGGETCNLNPPRSNCPTALKELSELHYSYLNAGYLPAILQSWKDQGCFNEVDSSLGYRLVGVLSRLPVTVGVGSSTNVGLRVRNIGWAAPFNYRSPQLVLRHATTSAEFASPLETNIDLRKWLPGDNDLSMTLTVPVSVTPGVYNVLLRLPDGEHSLKNTPEYNIVMENLDDNGHLTQRLNLLGTITVV